MGRCFQKINHWCGEDGHYLHHLRQICWSHASTSSYRHPSSRWHHSSTWAFLPCSSFVGLPQSTVGARFLDSFYCPLQPVYWKVSNYFTNENKTNKHDVPSTNLTHTCPSYNTHHQPIWQLSSLSINQYCGTGQRRANQSREWLASTRQTWLFQSHREVCRSEQVIRLSTNVLRLQP